MTLTTRQVLEEDGRISGLITDLAVSDEEVDAAIEAFKKLDADPRLLAECVRGFGLTMEARSKHHMRGSGSSKP